MIEIIKNIINDTLKNKGKWSKTNLTMFVSFWIGNMMAIIDFFNNGFRIDVFLLYMGCAMGFKYFDHIKDKTKQNEDEGI